MAGAFDIVLSEWKILVEKIRQPGFLRTNGADTSMVAFVDPAGKINEAGVPVNADYVGIRPAMWIDLSYDE